MYGASNSFVQTVQIVNILTGMLAMQTWHSMTTIFSAKLQPKHRRLCPAKKIANEGKHPSSRKREASDEIQPPHITGMSETSRVEGQHN